MSKRYKVGDILIVTGNGERRIHYYPLGIKVRVISTHSTFDYTVEPISMDFKMKDGLPPRTQEMYEEWLSPKKAMFRYD